MAHRRRQRRVKPAEVDLLVAGYKTGMTVKALAAAFGIHRDTVTRHLRQRGVPIRSRGLTDDQIADAAQLYLAGWSSLRLANRFDVAPDTVLAALRKTGVPVRPSHGGPRRAGQC